MEQFQAAHDPQLKSINFPMVLMDQLYQKLNSKINDITDAFEIRSFEKARSMLFSKKDLHADSSLFIVDHIWSNDGGKQAYEKLKKSPELIERLAAMFNIHPHAKPEEVLDLNRQIYVLAQITASAKNTVEQALDDEESDTIGALVRMEELGDEVESLEPEPKKRKEKCTFEEFKAAMISSNQIVRNENESYLKTMYQHYLDGGDGSGSTSLYNWTDDGSTITVFVSVSSTVKKQSIKSTLTIKNWKLVINDIELINGELFATVKPDECYWNIDSPGVLCMTLEKVECINLWAELIQDEEQLSPDVIFSTSWLKEKHTALFLKEILDGMWSYNQVYVYMSSDGVKRKPLWYIMDEYGSALTHGKEANFKCSPFFDTITGKTYSLIWPIRDVPKGAVCQRNFIPQIMSQENQVVYRARLKAFTGSKIFLNVPTTNPVKKELNLSSCKVVHLKKENISAEQRQPQVSIHASKYNNDVSVDLLSNLSRDVAISNEQQVDFNLLTIDDTSIMIDQDALPTSEVFASTDYFQNFLKFTTDDCDWFSMSYILPRDLEKFCLEFESSDLSSYWIVKEVDNRTIEVPIAVTSSYSRIVRMCEPGSIAVSKFVTDQPKFRHHRFVLSYTVILSMSDHNIFVYKEPLIRQAKERYNPTSLIDEYDTSTDITEKPEKLVGNQDSESFADFKVGMNKLLLPVNPDKGWDIYQDKIFQTIGCISKSIIGDLVLNKHGKSFVTFGADILLDSSLTPTIIDVNGISNLPHQNCLKSLLEFVMGNHSDDFVQVIVR